MKNRCPEASLSTQLTVLTKLPLDQADDAALVSAAQAVWYSDGSLENALAGFLQTPHSEMEVRRAGYLLERFTQFTCATNARVSEAYRALGLIAGSKVANVKCKGRVDQLALSWGLEQGLGLKVQALLPFQTRHYEASQRTQ
jgi:hypothetical protein